MSKKDRAKKRKEKKEKRETVYRTKEREWRKSNPYWQN